jgi:ferredoxin
MAGTRSAGLSAQRLEALGGLEAIARVERAICGDAVAREQAVAEGLALSGARAASLAPGSSPGTPGGAELPGASCVHHRTGPAGEGRVGGFELAADSAQQAIDHSLAAHLLSLRLGRAGSCSLEACVAERLELVRLPTREMLRALLEVETGEPEPRASAERIVELAGLALRTVGGCTGRPLDLVDVSGEGASGVVLVSSGAEAAPARAIARALGESDVAAAAVALALVRPFPAECVRQALRGARHVFALGAAARQETLLAEVRRAADPHAEVQALPDVEAGELLERIIDCLPGAARPATRPAPAAAPPARRLVVVPAGPWSDETARRLAAAVAHLGPLALGPHTEQRRGATLLAWESEALNEDGGDLLLAADPGLLRADGCLSLVRPGGTVVIASRAGSAQAVAQAIRADARNALRERELRAHHVALPDPQRATTGSPPTPEDASFLLAGAGIAACCGAAGRSGTQAARAVAVALQETGRGAAARWIRAGAEGVEPLPPSALDPSRHVEEVDFRPARNLPRMPATAEDDAERKRWAEPIRHFHLEGRPASFTPPVPLRPAVLGSLAESLRGASPHPFILSRRSDPDRPIAARGLADALAEATAALQADGRGARILADNLERLTTACARRLAEGPAACGLDSLLRAVGEPLATQLQVPEAELETLREDLSALAGRLPDGGLALGLDADTPLCVYLEVVDAVRAPLHRRFVSELGRLREGLRDLLQLDRMASREGRAPPAISAALGSAATRFLDPKALAQTLPEGSRAGDLGEARRLRVRAALDAIERHLELESGRPRVVFLQEPSLDRSVASGEVRRHPEPLAAAVGMFDGLSRSMARVFAAVRTARLELEGRYEPERHDAALADLDWEGFTENELLLLPVVAVLTTGRRLRERHQAALSHLLRSGRPVHVIALDEVGAEDEAQDLSRFHVDLGYLAVAHREAFAMGSTLARPDAAVAGLVEMARVRGPALALFPLPAREPARLRPLLAEAALQGRACLDFRYAPDAGPSWADRFDLEDNPSPERAWPRHRIVCLEGESERTLELSFTFADAVALEPAYVEHFQVVPPAAWSDAQVPLADYLEGFDPGTPEPAVPFVWVIDDAGTLQRAIVTRELAFATRDRLRGWRVLQELAGYENVFAERAAAAARDRTLAEAEERRALALHEHAEELERVRSGAARESMERLAAALLGADGVAMPAAATAAPPPPPAQSTPAPAPAEAAAAPRVDTEEEEISFDEPWIDTPLCTTCNECTKLNSRMFQYNAEKQAFIADAAAGTFAELVKAAELCPARCIHPGKPRSDDSSATPAVMERASAFH